MRNRICFVELPAAATGPSKTFYADAFGFSMTDFRPTYACTMTGDVDLGLQADAKEASRAPLPVIQVESLPPVMNWLPCRPNDVGGRYPRHLT